jgi:hypothetical protein
MEMGALAIQDAPPPRPPPAATARAPAWAGDSLESWECASLAILSAVAFEASSTKQFTSTPRRSCDQAVSTAIWKLRVGLRPLNAVDLLKSKPVYFWTARSSRVKSTLLQETLL